MDTLQIDQTGGMSWAAEVTRKTVATGEVTNKTKDKVVVGVEGEVVHGTLQPRTGDRFPSSFDFLVLEPIYPLRLVNLGLLLMVSGW